MEASVGGSENRVVWFHLHTFVVYLSLSVVTRSRFSLMVLSIMRWSFVIMFLFFSKKAGTDYGTNWLLFTNCLLWVHSVCLIRRRQHISVMLYIWYLVFQCSLERKPCFRICLRRTSMRPRFLLTHTVITRITPSHLCLRTRISVVVAWYVECQSVRSMSMSTWWSRFASQVPHRYLNST